MRLGMAVPDTWMVPPKAYEPVADLEPEGVQRHGSPLVDREVEQVVRARVADEAVFDAQPVV